ncbi:GILT-like protein 1 [Coccinella septempunctata]|uniref:GILT-like protein 1 n=1 Tax=Coccinella septempunctata TaxID=41139 RepID=UPI001D095DFD|nr:GILT-like protein 1 [Coccinella septempunctata]XP_044758215.1 GILT-like protein 1 [Coccinella septempunctata]
MGFSKQYFRGIFAVILIGYASSEPSLTKVSVYYESLCPDSINFIANELFPNYENFKGRILVDLVPYGKASQSKAVSGDWIFRCQHGSDECRGNKYQACALNQKKGQDNDVKFVNCAMTLADPSDPSGIENCANQNGYNWNTLTACFEGRQGGDLLAAYGDRTHNLKPKLRFVPTIMLDDEFDQSVQNQCLHDLAGALCSKMSEPKPKVCGS